MNLSPNSSPPLGRIEASIFGESALLDRETSRIFWESGTSSTLYESLTPKLDQYGAEHFQAMLLTGILSFAVLGIVAGWIQRLIATQLPEGASSSLPQLNSNIITLLLSLAKWTLLKLPRIENKWLVMTCILLYLLESYNCSTRRFLAHAMSSTTELDDYLERLRQEPPVVTWNVKTFHYEYRRVFLLPQLLQTLVCSLSSMLSLSPTQKMEQQEVSAISSPIDYALQNDRSARHTPPKSFLTRKVITNEASATYQFTSCRDDTMVGVWTRAEAFRDDELAPFTKIGLTKLLILADGKTREAYFQQQSDFVTQHGQGDEFAEFSTDIQVAGYRPRILVLRPKRHAAAKLFRLHFFWVFTLLGLTVPYRIWFKQHCDFVRVAIVKETSCLR
jgi:hypothetical protein